MKKEIESKEYWALPDLIKDKYKQVTLELTAFGWIERRMFGSHGTQQLKTVYRLRAGKDNPRPFSGHGSGTF